MGGPRVDTQTSAFDATELLERMGGDHELLAELLELFREDAGIQGEALRSSIAASDAEALFEAGHALKGSAANFTADRVVDLAFQLESLGRSGTTEGAQPIFVELESAIDELITGLTEFVSGH